MKLKIKKTSFKVTPKQKKRSTRIKGSYFKLSPKPYGIIIKKVSTKGVLTDCWDNGVILKRIKETDILKQYD